MIICVYYENEVYITWDKVPEADGYKFYQKTGDHLYTSFKEVLDNKVSLQEAVELIKRNSRRYAKKQLTYWGRDNSINWLNF